MKAFGTAAILAGGKGVRMGFDKQLLEIGGKRVVETIIAALKDDFEDVLVISYRPELYEGLGVRVLPDILPDNGLLGGIHAALFHAQSRYTYIVACDMPHLNPFFIHHMRTELERTGASICLASNGEWIESMNAFYSKELVPAIERHLAGGERSVYSFVMGQNTHYIAEAVARRFCPDYRMFLNLNTEDDLRKYRERVAAGAMPAATMGRRMKKYRDGAAQWVEDPVVTEYGLTIRLNGHEFVMLLCTPAALRELVVGYLFSEGIIDTVADIAELALDEAKGIASVAVAGDRAERFLNGGMKRRTVTSGCSGGITTLDPLERTVPDTGAAERMRIDPERLAALMGDFNRRSEIFIETGGVHSCALAEEDGILLFREDIGRHNALDKVAGEALLRGIPLAGKLVLTSGRISSEIVAKVARHRPAAIVSRSAPTATAITRAAERGIGLVGFARGKNMNIYTRYDMFPVERS
ncbi:MAG TPA: formate dehydrogenase accessory sulfurtransferase FdhD [bacterium]|nr:formate dehydrogenase accessory sulfurtransferase FdhD [bacterium]